MIYLIIYLIGSAIVSGLMAYSVFHEDTVIISDIMDIILGGIVWPLVLIALAYWYRDKIGKIVIWRRKTDDKS